MKDDDESDFPSPPPTRIRTPLRVKTAPRDSPPRRRACLSRAMQAGPSTAAMPPPAATLRVHASDGSVLLAYAHQGPPLDVPLLMPSPSPNPPLPPGNMACYPRDVFLRNFEAFSGGAFKSLSPAQWIELGIVVAGGSVCACLTTQIATGRWRTYPSADVDAFVIAQTEDEALRKVREFCDVASIKRGATYVRTPNTISIVAAHRRNVQIVLRIYPNIAAILAEFDVDSCALAWDGSDVHATERSNRALVTRVNIVDVAYRSWSFEKRLIKYAKRGFAIGVPGLDLARAAPFELVECHVHRSKLPPSHPLHRPPDADAANARSYYNLNAADFALVRRVQRPLRLYTLVELNQLDEYSAERFSFWQTYQELTGLKKLLVAHHLFPRTDPSASKEGRNRCARATTEHSSVLHTRACARASFMSAPCRALRRACLRVQLPPAQRECAAGRNVAHQMVQLSRQGLRHEHTVLGAGGGEVSRGEQGEQALRRAGPVARLVPRRPHRPRCL